MKSKSRVLTAVLAVGLLALAVLTGCGKSSGTEKATLSVALAGDIVSLDPAFAYDYTTNPVVNQITEGLLAYDADSKVMPKLAKSWKADNPTTYVYEIRSDVKFSDGTPMTMEDVLFSLNRVMDPATASYLGWMYSNVDSITPTGDWQITIKLKRPDALWQYTLATTAGHVVSKAYHDAHAENFGKPDGGVMGTGAYVYKSWTTGSEIVLERNPNYWDKSAKIEVEKIVFKIIPENTTRVTAMITGQVDFAIDPPVDMLDQITASKAVNVATLDGFGIDFIAFNCERKPFDDANVRRAIYSAIDRQAISKNIIKDTGTPANSLPMSKALWTIETDKWEKFAKELPVYGYDLGKAKEYLAKSSAANGFDMGLICNEDSVKNSIVLAVQENLKALNINVSIEKVSADELISIQFGGRMKDGKRDYDAMLAMWESDFPDPAGNLTSLYSSANKGEGGSNTAAYSNDPVQQLIEAQTVSTDAGERTRLMQQAFTLANEDAPYVMVNYPKKILVTNKRISGFKLNAAWIWNLYMKDIKLH